MLWYILVYGTTYSFVLDGKSKTEIMLRENGEKVITIDLVSQLNI